MPTSAAGGGRYDAMPTSATGGGRYRAMPTSATGGGRYHALGEEPLNTYAPARRGFTYVYSTAITLSSTAIGVGRAPISSVVRVGLGLPSPAKYSA